MFGRLLIADDSASRRILLRARLAESFRTIRALPRAEARAPLREEGAEVAIVDLSAPEAEGLALLRAFRADPALPDLQIIALLPRCPGACRRAALEAGADDTLDLPVEAPRLLARLRSLMRTRSAGADLSLRAEAAALIGLADPAPAYCPRGSVALVAERPEMAQQWRSALMPFLRDRLEVVEPERLMAEMESAAGADAFVVALGPDRPAEGLRLIAELRARAGPQRAGILGVLAGAPAEAEIAALDLGANAVVAAPVDPGELALRLRRELARTARIDRLRRQLSDGLRLAVTDPLTGLGNRRLGLAQLARVAEAAAAEGQPFAVMVLDLDRFKQVNDCHGHAAGDAVLVEVARRIAAPLRAEDVLARIGGEEFLAVLPETGPEAAEAAAERLRAAVGGLPVVLPSGAALNITVSIGVAVAAPAAGAVASPQALVCAADRALYASKCDGRNLVTLDRSAA